MDRSAKAVWVAALKVVGLYMPLGCLWLMAFDGAMDALELRFLEPYADLIFLLGSSAVFYFVLVRFMGQHDRIQRELEQQRGLAGMAQLQQQHNVSLRALNIELERSNAELEQFAYIASHDLRQPLRIVNSYLSLTESHLKDVLDDDAREFMGHARDGARRMDRLITDLLEYSRAGRGKDAPQTVDLNAVVEEVTALLGLDLTTAGGRVLVSGSLPTITANRLEMAQLFQNLIGNAVKYRHPDRPPVITVSARQVDDRWEIVVADNGIGIAAGDYDRIFLIFQRLHAKNSFEGTGIGLAIVRKVVERRGGSITVRSVPDEGSEFTVTLPTEMPTEMPDTIADAPERRARA
jgi:light-regulated signal transduction histidine kinase (bacteriophytochrome)